MSDFRGIDGCRSGWVCVDIADRSGQVRVTRAFVAPTIAEALRAECERIAIDIPIGLLDCAQYGGRAPEVEARALLGPRRASSVFSAPVRAATRCDEYPAALDANRCSSPQCIGLSKQAFAIAPKIREVDIALVPDLQARVVETHPELIFLALTGSPMAFGKKTREGGAARVAALRDAGLIVGDDDRARLRSTGAKADDVNDAAACAWTAWRVATGAARRIPAEPPTDSRGLRMEMWF